MNYATPKEKNAFYISAFTHPLLMPVAGFIVLNNFNTTSFQGQSLYLLLLVFSITVVGLPSYFVFALKRSGYISSYEMETLQERRLPLIFSAAVMLFNYYLMQRTNLPSPFPGYFLSISTTAILATGISLFYKISLHTIGIGFLFGLGLVLSNITNLDIRWFLIGMILLGGIIGYSRIILKAHTLPQIYWGFFVGVVCAMGMLFFV